MITRHINYYIHKNTTKIYYVARGTICDCNKFMIKATGVSRPHGFRANDVAPREGGTTLKR